MDENLHNIEELFHSALDDNEETPSANSWEGIDKRLDKDSIVSIKRKYINLKRVAALLLLLLVSFVLYDVYKTNDNHNGKGFAKNNKNINPDNQNKYNEAADKASNKKIGTNSAIPTGTNSITDTDKANAAPDNLNAGNKKSTDTKQEGPINIYPLQKQNITEATSSAKDISKNQTTQTAIQKKKLNSKPYYKVKIINAKPIKDDDLLVMNNDEPVNNQVPFLTKINTAQIERLKLNPKDFIDTKKILHPITASKINVPGTSKTAMAKNTQNKKSKLSRFSITPFFSPDIAWYHLKDDKPDNNRDDAKEIEKAEQHEFSFTTGVLVDYKLNKHWGLQSGITLSKINISVDPKTIYAQPDNTGNIKYAINSSSGYGYVLPSYSTNPAIGDSLYAFTTKHSLQYVGVPLTVTYRITKGKFNFNAMAGLSVNILTGAKLETSVENGFDNSFETINKLQGLQKTYFSGTAGIGAAYKLTKKTAITFVPTLRFALNPINKDAAVKSYPMSLGLAVGLKIDL